MDLLPEECLDNIVSYLDVVSLTRLGLSSNRLRASCFSPRYWTNVDLSSCHAHNINIESIKHLSKFATKLKILNIQNCHNVNLEAIVPFVFLFKSLELIKHDGQHRLLDETVAINRMLNNAEKLIDSHRNDNNLASEESKAKFDNAVRQARALIWDALYIAAANKRGTSLPDEQSFQNIHHPQETLNIVVKKLRDTEKLLQKPLKLWRNSMTSRTSIESASLVKNPRTQKVYLAFGATGEIVLWDLEARSEFKVFNYLDSFETVSMKNVKKAQNFSSVLMFERMDRVLLFGGTSRGAICWDIETKQVIYDVRMPLDESEPGKNSKHYARQWTLSNNQQGFVQTYDGIFPVNFGTGLFGPLIRVPEKSRSDLIIWSSKNIGLALIGSNENGKLVATILNLLTNEKKGEITTLSSSQKPGYGDNYIDWYDDRLIACHTLHGIEVYQVDQANHYTLRTTIATPTKKVSTLKFLSDQLLLINSEVFVIDTGALRIPSGHNATVVYSPELNVVVHVQDIGVVAMYNAETGEKVALEPYVTSLRRILKIDNETVLLNGYVSHQAEKNYATLSIRNGDLKLIETVETQMPILDVSSDGKYALALDKHYGWHEKHDAIFVVFDLETKEVIFRKSFKGDQAKIEWFMCAVGQFMPQHPNQVLLSHPKCGFQILDVKSGEIIHDYSHDEKYGGVGSYIKVSSDDRFVVYKSLKGHMSCNLAVDLQEKKLYHPSGHTNSFDSITFNPINSSQLVTAGYGVSVFNLPNPKRAFFLSRYIDGLVETIRESEEVTCVKFSPDGKYLAAVDPPSRGPWGLEIANTLIRVYETTKFTLVSSFDTGGQARALYWLDNERAIVGLVNGEMLTLQLVVKEYRKLFEYIVPSKAPRE